MPATRRTKDATRKEPGTAFPTTRFFEDQLNGEPALTFATANRLFHLASQVSFIKPWRTMRDTDLVLVKDPASRQMCYCSALGAAGETFAILVYQGMDSFRLFRKIVSGAPLSTGDYLAEQRSVTLELMPSELLERPDRELARTLGHSLKNGCVAPQFRAGRPGYHPWYPTEAEGKLLANCAESVLAFCQHREAEPEVRYWTHEDVYPRVFWQQNATFWVENVIAREKPPATPEPAQLDEARLANLSKSDYPVRGVIELDEFYSGIPIGGPNERKACMRVVLAADADTQFIYMVEALTVGQARATVMAEGMLKVIEQHRFVPAELRVKRETDLSVLAPLKGRLGFKLSVTNLPSLARAKAELLRHLGDPEEIPGR